jgi:hypothetical protein
MVRRAHLGTLKTCGAVIMRESDAGEFPCLPSALDSLYAIFDPGAPERGRSGYARNRFPSSSGGADSDSFLSSVLRLEDIERHKDVLPRALELLAVADNADHSWPIMNKIAAHWQGWPESERAAIQAFVRAWWRVTLSAFPRRLDVYEFFDIVGTVRVDIDPYLSYWESDTGEPAARHLAWLVRDFTVHSASSDEWYETLDRWIDGTAPRMILERALSAHPDARAGQEISSALDLVRSWARG